MLTLAEESTRLPAVPGPNKAHLNPKRVCPLSDEQLVELIIRFVEVYNAPAGIVLHHYQLTFIRRIVESIIKRDSATITGLWCRQSGKSESLAALGGGLCVLLPALTKQFPEDPRLSQYVEGFWIGIFAPKREQAELIYNRVRSRAEREDMHDIYQDPDINVRVSASRGNLISWSNGSFVNAMTASEQSNSEGRTYHLMFLDEAQLVSKQKINKELRPMLAHTNGSFVEIGTANAMLGNFRETILQNERDERDTGVRNHFEFPYDVVIAQRRATYERTGDEKHLNYEKWVTAEIKRIGNTENEEFRQNFRLLWRNISVGAIDLDSFLEAADEEREALDSHFGGRIVAGMDFGRKRDATILTIGFVDPTPLIDHHIVIRPGGDPESRVFHALHIIAWFEIPGKKWRDILTTAVSLLSNYSLETLYCDATGVGDPLTEMVQDLMPEVAVVGYLMSAVGNDRAYKYYCTEMEAKRITYAAGPETQETPEYAKFVHEHENLIKDKKGVYTKFYAPEGEHDDYPDSAVLCAMAAQDTTTRALPEAESAENPLYENGGNSRSSRANRYR